MQLRTNNVPRRIIDGTELTPVERKEFDYLTDEELAGRDFVRYRGVVYDLCDFETSYIPGWLGQQTDSYFSAVVFRLVNAESVVMGTAYC